MSEKEEYFVTFIVFRVGRKNGSRIFSERMKRTNNNLLRQSLEPLFAHLHRHPTVDVSIE